MASNDDHRFPSHDVDLTTYGSIVLETFPPTSATMTLQSFQLHDHQATVTLSLAAPAENLTKGTPCIALKYEVTAPGGGLRTLTKRDVKLDDTTTDKLDLLDAGAFGPCTVAVSVVPEVPFGTEQPAGSQTLNEPLDVPIDLAANTAVGMLVQLTPVSSDTWAQCALRLTIRLQGGKQDPTKIRFVWKKRNRDALQWRVGCLPGEQGTHGSVLAYASRVATAIPEFAVSAKLEITDADPDGKKPNWRDVWDRSLATVARPRLAELSLRDNGALLAAIADGDWVATKIQEIVGDSIIWARIRITGLAADFALPLEAQLWGYRRIGDDPNAAHYAIAPLADPVPAPVSGGGATEIPLLDIASLTDVELQRLALRQPFVVLRASPAATGTTPYYAPFCEVVDYNDDAFLALYEELGANMPPPAPPDAASRARKGLPTRKSFCPAVSSLDFSFAGSLVADPSR